MLVICCGMIRSGSTLQYQIAVELIESHNLGMTMGWVRTLNQEFLSALQNVAKRQDKYLVVKTHDYTPEASKLIRSGMVKTLYCYRDLRDVAASLSHKFLNSVDEALASIWLDKALINYYQWTSLTEILISKYDDLLNNLRDEIYKIATYLEIEVDEVAVNKIANKLSLNQQHQYIESFNYKKHGIRVSKDDVYDPVSQLHNNHIYSGALNQWTESFTPEQTQFIEMLAFSWFIGLSYPLATCNPSELPVTQSIRQYYKLAKTAIQQQNPSQTVTLCHQAILLAPHISLFHFLLGEALLQTNNYRAAIIAYYHALYLKPKSFIYRLGLGDALIQIKKLSEAVEQYKIAIELIPTDPRPYEGLARAFAQQNKFKIATDYYQKASLLRESR